MKRNGTQKPRRFDADLRFENQIRAADIGARLQAVEWIRRWKKRPHRTFWEIDPITGERREL